MRREAYVPCAHGSNCPQAPFTGSYRPVLAGSGGTLNSLLGNAGINPNGCWTLRMVDKENTGFTGVFNSWTLTLTYTTSNGTYSWSSTPAGYSSNVQNPGTVSNITQTTTYTVTYTAQNGCPATSNVTVNVTQPPTTANAGPDQAICNSGSFTLAGNTPTVGTGTWSIVEFWNGEQSQILLSPTSSVTGFRPDKCNSEVDNSKCTLSVIDG